MHLPKVAWALLLAFPAAAAHADIYACTGKGRSTVYQNFSCDLDSIGATGPKTTTQVQPGITASKMSTKPTPTAARSAAESGVSFASEPRLGMSRSEVKALWGEPASIYADELVDGRVEVWSYDQLRSVHFNLHGRVVAIERQGRREQ
jgi:hypothetical protein